MRARTWVAGIVLSLLVAGCVDTDPAPPAAPLVPLPGGPELDPPDELEVQPSCMPNLDSENGGSNDGEDCDEHSVVPDVFCTAVTSPDPDIYCVTCDNGLSSCHLIPPASGAPTPPTPPPPSPTMEPVVVDSTLTVPPVAP